MNKRIRKKRAQRELAERERRLSGLFARTEEWLVCRFSMVNGVTIDLPIDLPKRLAKQEEPKP